MNRDDKIEMGKRLKEALNNKGMKQNELVRLLNDAGFDTITEAKVSDYIHGRRCICSKIRQEISDILDVKREWLFLDKTENDMCIRWK